MRATVAAALLGAAAWGAVAAAQDYLAPDLRARVEALKADVERTPSNRANARARARTFWDWINAYALAGRYVPVNATAVASGVLAYPGRAGRIAALDPAVRELALLDEQPDAVGALAADSGPFAARRHATIRQTYTVGAKDIEPGGGFVVARHFMTGIAYQTDDAAGDNYVSIAASNPNVRFSKSALPMGGMHGGFRRALDTLVFRVTSGNLTAGDTVTITYGDTRGGGRGLLLPHFSSDRLPLPLYIDFDGSQLPISLPIQPIVVTGGGVAGVDGFAPSVVATGEAFSVAVRARDRFYNRATGPVPAWEVWANGDRLGRIAAGEAALSVLPNIRFDSPGVYRLAIRSQDGVFSGAVNPILVEDAPRRRVYWGDTHVHSGFAEGVGSAERLMTWAREDARLDFVTHSEHDIWMDDREWQVLAENVRRFSEEGEFVAFLGYEWTVQNTQGGHHNVLFRTPDAGGAGPRRRVPAQEYGTLSGLHQGLRARHDPADVVVIPHAHQAGDYRLHDPRLAPVVEIMSQHGTFEWFGRMYLRNGHQVGFVAASDNHLSQPGYSAPQGGSLSQWGGLAALRAPSRTRDALFDALRGRAAYATTGERMILDFTVNGAQMGTRAAFAEERRLAGRVIGTAPIDHIAVVKNGEEIWRGEYLTDAKTQGVGDGEYLLVFESDSTPYHPGDNPRGWRWWWGELAVRDAVVRVAQGMDFHTDHIHSLDVTDGSAVAFRTYTRGGTSAIKLALGDVRRTATLTLKLREGREFGGGPPRFRAHQMVPAADLTLELRRLEAGVLRREVPFGGYVDRVTLRRVVSDGKMDVSFALTDAGDRQGDYYYVRVKQANDALAWASPVWVGGFPSR